MLRAINVGTRRLSMPALRDLLDRSDLEGVRTYLQSGNAVVRSDAPPHELAAACRRLISEHCGFDVPVIARTLEDIEAVIELDPLGTVAAEPKRYWVSFLDGELDEAAVSKLAGRAAGDERVEVHGREIYAWLPDGGGRSKLASAMAAPARTVTATCRNWVTVRALRDLARTP